MGLMVDHYNKTTELYEVYGFTKDFEVLTDGKLKFFNVDTECFTCDVNGKIEKHEIWSDLFDEYRECQIKESHKKWYAEVYANVEKQLADAIHEYNQDDANFDEPWKVLALKVKEQL